MNQAREAGPEADRSGGLRAGSDRDRLVAIDRGRTGRRRAEGWAGVASADAAVAAAPVVLVRGLDVPALAVRSAVRCIRAHGVSDRVIGLFHPAVGNGTSDLSPGTKATTESDDVFSLHGVPDCLPCVVEAKRRRNIAW